MRLPWRRRPPSDDVLRDVQKKVTKILAAVESPTTERQILTDLRTKVEKLMATEESVLAQLTQLKTDLEAVATAAEAEFAKLEKEVAEGKPVNLEPLATIVGDLDTKVKGVVVPTA